MVDRRDTRGSLHGRKGRARAKVSKASAGIASESGTQQRSAEAKERERAKKGPTALEKDGLHGTITQRHGVKQMATYRMRPASEP